MTAKLSGLARRHALEAARRRLLSAASLLQNLEEGGPATLDSGDPALELAQEDAEAAARLLDRVAASDAEVAS